MPARVREGGTAALCLLSLLRRLSYLAIYLNIFTWVDAKRLSFLYPHLLRGDIEPPDGRHPAHPSSVSLVALGMWRLVPTQMEGQRVKWCHFPWSREPGP